MRLVIKGLTATRNSTIIGNKRGL